MKREIPHGTRSGYVNHGCRCDECRTATREYNRQYRRQRQNSLEGRIAGDESWHGTLNGHAYHGCRCELCRSAKRDYDRSRRTRLRSEAITGTEEWHGSYTGYGTRGCRCERCREAWAEYTRDYRRRNRAAVQARRRRWYEANRDKVLEQSRQYRLANLSRVEERQRKDRQDTGYDRARELPGGRRFELRHAAQSAPNRGAAWTVGDDAVAIDASLSEAEKVFILGRSLAALRKRIARLNDQDRHLPRSRRYQRWTAEEDAVVRRADISLREKSLRVGRSIEAVVKRINTLNRRARQSERAA